MLNFKFIFSLFSFFCFIFFNSCTKQVDKSTVNNSNEFIRLLQNDTGVFEVYNSNNELLLEFTPENTDSSSLETLDFIYKVTKEK